LLTACLPACPALQMCLSWLRASSRQQRSKQPLLLPPLLVDACSSWPAGGGAAALPFSLPQAYSVAPAQAAACARPQQQSFFSQLARDAPCRVLAPLPPCYPIFRWLLCSHLASNALPHACIIGCCVNDRNMR
jgi:hypothetical protein